jgi:tetratricopeptide (TPR) repeat protein
MRRVLRAGAVLGAALALRLAGAPVARAQVIGQGFELERQGKYEQAATVYRNTLRAEPANLSALLGLERVLPPLGRLADLLPLVHRALEVDSVSAPLRGLLLRTFAGINALDSAEVVAQRWIAAAPASETPWREWAVALEDQRLFDDAHRVLLAGRRALNRTTALAFELADLAQRSADWEGAGTEWGNAVTAVPEMEANAVSQLDDAPADQRERVARALTAPGAGAAQIRVAATLLLGWGQPMRAWTLLEGTITAQPREALRTLRLFADRAAAVGGVTPEAKRVRGLALARLADVLGGGPLATRTRADAARAFLDAGDRVAARAALERVVADSAAPADAQALAQGTLIEVLIADGQLDAAGDRLRAMGDRLEGETRDRLRLRLAEARISRGEFAKAEAALAGDSSLEAASLRGWAALYRGDLKRARDQFREAGPYAGDRIAATERTAMLALLQQVSLERSEELGSALQLLARGDSTAAVTALQRAAERLPDDGGRADVRLRAGQVAARLGGTAQDSVASQLFAAVVQAGGAGAAPAAAELDWARLLLRRGRASEAIPHLEHLILTYPTSAVIPEARRELERAKGTIPRS